MKLEIIFPSVVLTILIIMSIVTRGYPPKPRLFPLIVIIITAILVAVQLIKGVWGKPKEKEAPKEEKVTEEVGLTKHFRAPAWIGAFLLFIYLIGYLAGTGLFSILYLRVNGFKWRTTTFFALGTVAFMYLGFELVLDTPLYKGFFFE